VPTPSPTSTSEDAADGDYVVGVEPANTKCLNRAALRREGRLPMLAPGEGRTIEVEFGVLEARRDRGLRGALPSHPGRRRMSKRVIPKTRDKNQIIANIVEALVRRKGFLLLGHRNPDDDCIASLVAFALLARKFAKPVSIYLGARIHEHFQYLLEIAGTTASRCCTPPTSCHPRGYPGAVRHAQARMIAANEESWGSFTPAPAAHRDRHHLGADSEYFGDPATPGDRGQLGQRAGGPHPAVLRRRPALLAQFNIQDLVSRNIVLAVVTGIIGDSRMGVLLKTDREKRAYRTFSTLFNNLLARTTVGESNFSDMNRCSRKSRRCPRARRTAWTSSCSASACRPVSAALPGDRDSARLARAFDADTVIAAARSVADRLAEESGWLGLVCYCDPPPPRAGAVPPAPQPALQGLRPAPDPGAVRFHRRRRHEGPSVSACRARRSRTLAPTWLT